MYKSLKGIRHPEVLVVGDVMIDQELHCTRSARQYGMFASRLDLGNLVNKPGGAGNVAVCSRRLGISETLLIGGIGTDEGSYDKSGQLLMAALEEHYIPWVLVPIQEWKTPRKFRVYCHNDMLVHIDDDPAFGQSPPPVPFSDLSYHLGKMSDWKVVVLVDHGKGLLHCDKSMASAAEFHAKLRRTGVPVILDPSPKTAQHMLSVGADTIIKLSEQQIDGMVTDVELLGRIGNMRQDDYSAYFRHVRRFLNEGVWATPQFLWLTLGRHGMLFGTMDCNDDAVLYLPPGLSGSDGTGCGDVCSAVMAAAIVHHGYNVRGLIRGLVLANFAAGLGACEAGTWQPPSWAILNKEYGDDLESTCGQLMGEFKAARVPARLLA